MPQTIGRKTAQRLLYAGAQVVDVLPHAVYRQGHLPGANNIPLARLRQDAVSHLKKDEPVVVYCFDFQRDLSPRAPVGSNGR